jgi:hypothetical protein
MRLSTLGVLLGLVAIPWASHASVTDFVTNNSFEDVQISGFKSTLPSDVPGWTKVGPDGDALIWRIGYNDLNGSVTVTGDGNQFVTLGCGFIMPAVCGTTSWSQTIGLPADTYNLAFDIAAEFGPGSFGGAIHTQSLTVMLSGGATASQAFSADGSNPGNYWQDWETKALPFTADGLPVTLTFSTTNLFADIGIDDVHIFTQQVFGVPAPSTTVLLGVGLAGLVALRRRRRRS